MKLYVFQVNNGSTLTFDTDLAVQTVLELKHAIQAKYKIAIQHQVLVVNGGECMAAERRVCSYSAGTETNPIFLFNKEMILCDRDPTIPKTTFSIESEIQVKVEESLLMPAVFHTVASRTQLALVEMFEVAKKLCSFCERLVHDEHLQHQGWAAIMANLDDCTLSYQKLLVKFDTSYANYQHDLEEIKVKLTKLGTAVSVMARIPLLESLTRHSYRESIEKSSSTPEKDSDETEEEKSTDSVLCTADAPRPSRSSASTCEPAGDQETNEMTDSGGLRAALLDDDTPEFANPSSFNVTLLDWINVQDRPNDVESVVRKCFDSINRLDPRIIQPFLADCRDTIAKLDNQNMKAIKGLEDRLYALDQMIASCKKLVNEQKELAQGFLANQKRAENLKDTSVLPDLCLSHTNQLMIMLNNHRKLLDIKKKCTTAKQELANNLQVRLKWCCYVMLHADQDGEKLQALLRLLTELMERVRVVEALSTVPQMYCLAVVEVVRRKMFMRHYREWAYALVKDGKRLYEAEKFKRESFGKLFRKSFLRNRLFRGLDSWPPTSFCTRKPRRFDDELPDISLEDLQYLKSCCPLEVQPFLMVPTMCDFEPLNHHVDTLHQLVQAAQSVDEMSQTITDLLSEQRASYSQSAQRSTLLTPQSESVPGTTTPMSSKTPSSLSLQGPSCQPLHVPVPAPLEDLSPDSIDAQTFDFETIGHPNMDPVLQQGSLDLDSLAESPESDFMSAVNEFVIEENLTSPNPISDPTSPDMMVESLYSSVINAIDNKRMQDTTTLERENLRISVLKQVIDKYRSAAEESHSNFRSVKDDLYHLRGQVLKEQHDFGFVLRSMTTEVRNIVDNFCQTHELELKEQHQSELLSLEGLMERKEKELTQLENERERWSEMECSQALEHLAAENKRDNQIKDLEARVTELAELRCKLEVELALKESETEEVRLLLEEAKIQQAEAVKSQVEAETKVLSEELAGIKKQLQVKNEEYEVDLAELRTLMRIEKDHCISELVDRHEEETILLRSELSSLQHFQELEQELRTLEQQKEELEKRLLEKITQLETELQERQSSKRIKVYCVPFSDEGLSLHAEGRADAGAPLSLDSALQERLQQERASLQSQMELLEKKKNEEIQNLKTSLIAEQQTNFNTVLTREKLKKEQIINELTEKLRKVTQQQEKDKALIETLSEDRASVMQEKKQLEEELNRLRKAGAAAAAARALPLVGACSSEPLAESDRLASVAAIRDDEHVDSAVEASMVTVHDNILISEEKQRILLLERTLHMKEEENKRLSQRLVICTTLCVIIPLSPLSIFLCFSFQVGDLVLIILDERHDNYVLFTVGPTLYFLHSESLTALDLKPASGTSRRPWVLGKVMEKEYCQAKKAQNRFKVPLGTKFYRVKAVPWNRKV
uniref:RB1-inducible coiled-coil protein 1 n=1 Tax=Lates calcarifer TaxID=8187 RepID=A0A4W6CIC7_LATCA